MLLALLTFAAATEAAKPTLYDMKAFTTDGDLMDLAKVTCTTHTSPVARQ